MRSLQAWIAAAGITEGALFRSINRHGQIGGRLSPRSVADTVKASASAAGLDGRAAYAGFSGHSLRAGYITLRRYGAAFRSPISKPNRCTRADVLFGYVRRENMLSNPTVQVGM